MRKKRSTLPECCGLARVHLETICIVGLFIYILMKLLLFTIAVFFCIAYKIMVFATAPGGLGRAGRTFGPTIILPAVKHTATFIMLHGLVRRLHFLYQISRSLL